MTKAVFNSYIFWEMNMDSIEERSAEESKRPDERANEALLHGKIEQPQTANMEVHYEPHHITHKKKWGEYLLEFFMLFLAVFLGFIAENIREDSVEHKRAKEFARLFIEDLAADTLELNRGNKVLKNIIIASDSTARLLKETNNTVSGGKLYYYEYWSGWKWSIISQDATLQQLENSGSLRFFGEPRVISKILDYEDALKVIYLLQNKYEPEKIENWNIVQKVFDQSGFDTLETIKGAARDASDIQSRNSPALDIFLKKNYRLNTYDKTTLFELRNWASNTARNYRILASNISDAKEKAREAIETLKSEYDLK
jgi:hypothetical protein